MTKGNGDTEKQSISRPTKLIVGVCVLIVIIALVLRFTLWN